MKVLNLYAGLGGNRKKWSKEHTVTAVEFDKKIADVYKKNNPNDNVVITDAHQYLLDHSGEFDFIWSSPPCPTHSAMAKATRHNLRQYPDMRLYQEIIYLQNFYKGLFVVENVKPYYEPLIKPTAILSRHYFWSNFKITNFEMKSPKGFITNGTVKASEDMKKWLGINYEGNIYYKDHHCPVQVLRNCVHPNLGLHILDCANGVYSRPKINQTELFI